MPTVIDSFVAEFTLDPKEFSKGAGTVRLDLKRTREDVAKTGKEFETFGKQGAAFLGKLRNEAVGLFLAFQGASSIGGFVTDLIKGDAATARLAGNIGMTTSRLSAWQLAIRGVGGDAKDADAALSSMANMYQSYLLIGTTGHDNDIRSLGLGLDDLASPEKALLKMAEAAERLGKPEFFARMQRLGVPVSVINQLEEGRKATEDLVTAKEKDGAATDADAAAAERLQKKLSDLQSHLTHLVRPAIYGLVTTTDDLVTKMDEGTDAAPIMATALAALGGVALIAGAPFVALAAAIGAVVIAATHLKEMGDLFQFKSGDQAEKNFEDWQAKQNAGRDAPSWRNLWGMFSLKRTGSTPEAAAASAGTPGAGVDHGYIQRALRGAGLSEEQIKGIDADITAEGGSLGMADNGAFGIGQWRGLRAKRLFAKYGTRKPNLQQQVEFLLAELQHGEGGERGGASVLGSTSAEAAMVAYLRDFMRPGPGLPGDLSRGYRALGKGTPAAGGTRGGTDQSTHVGTIVVHVAHGNADEIAARLPDAIRRRRLTTQANRGLA